MKLKLITILFFLPLFALAHGEEVLIPVFGQALLFFITVFILFFWKTKINKLSLFLVYLLSLCAIVFLSWNVPYRQNRTILDASLIVGPAVMTLIAFGYLKKKEKSRTQQ